MVDTGLGPYQDVNFISDLNIPPVHVKSLKQREREVGVKFEEVADVYCSESLADEIEANRYVFYQIYYKPRSRFHDLVLSGTLQSKHQQKASRFGVSHASSIQVFIPFNTKSPDGLIIVIVELLLSQKYAPVATFC